MRDKSGNTRKPFYCAWHIAFKKYVTTTTITRVEGPRSKHEVVYINYFDSMMPGLI